MSLRVCVCTVGGQSIRLSSLRVRSVHGRLLHAAELGLTGVRGHGRGCWRGENVRVWSGGGREITGQVNM